MLMGNQDKKKKKNLFCSIIQLLIKIYFVLFYETEETSSRSAPHLLVSVISQEMSDLEAHRKRMML